MIGFGASGFGKTPVSKALFILVMMSSLWFGLSNRQMLLGINFGIWYLPLAIISFTSMLELFFGALILYSFRHFERIFGSRKYASLLLFLSASTLFLQVLSFSFKSIRLVLMPGPYFIIFGLYVYFFSIIPSISSFKILGIELSEKLIMYAFGVQLAISNFPGSFFASICGVMLGILHKASVLPFQKLLIPEFIAAKFDRIFGPLMMTDTIENGFHRAQRSSTNMAMQDHRTTFTPPNENDVTVLVGMGFSEDAVRRALAETHNNVHLATEILLEGDR